MKGGVENASLKINTLKYLGVENSREHKREGISYIYIYMDKPVFFLVASGLSLHPHSLHRID